MALKDLHKSFGSNEKYLKTLGQILYSLESLGLNMDMDGSQPAFTFQRQQWKHQNDV